MEISTSLVFLAILHLAAAGSCPASGSPTYPKATEQNTAFIPFLKKFPLIDSTPSLEFSVATKWSAPLHVAAAGMDTGSTGVMIGGGLLGFSDTTQFDKSHPGNEYLSSSGRLWQGYWIDANLTFYSAADERANRQEIIATVPVMVVTEASICRAWKTQGSCSEAQKSNITMWPKDIHYIGVGFGRGSSEQPDALPDKVPLIHITQIGQNKVKGIHQGYIITKDGVEVGLTSDNAERFSKTRLELRPGSNDTDWQMVKMAIKINDSPWNYGHALFDTGIPQAYVAVYKEVSSRANTTMSTFIKTHPKVLASKNKVVVSVPDDKNPIATYTVTVQGDGMPDPATMQPSGFVMEAEPSKEKGPYINTGRMFYNGFEAMFDSECGWFGLSGISGDTEKRPVCLS
ncbi:outer membrane autotransporter barrel protein [Colletotrichum tofieldiae]|uniref:Outer membrane autotransporter barrel protein (Adhesin aidA-I) n=1 Tax=Colletotrichum tofieldiae TaxID=708197 RepID=A0A166T766_9PEZI|nr:outer membrane autotransporter barrel protein (adhesin aidA-I) [Colletotrichum tofieldiae]GKT65628.1 outer membrane autotransporter barrel protein [Colletotrichum tofieldiae]GKT71187.1 outer membrane autotransporter barrel protein [Colletotrichum tofieldiae]GKT93902.1 outer membrane autotransporter barrel protein [Colletotrichum tofieldiae]